jgi:hypothetical protein
MRNSRRYRLNAAECLSAATTCQGDYRSLLVSIAGSWQALARQEEAMEKLLVSWGIAEPARKIVQVLAFQPTSRAAGLIRPREALFASRRQRHQIDTQR